MRHLTERHGKREKMKCLGKTPAVLRQVDREEGDAGKKREVCALHFKETGKFGCPDALTSH